MIGRAEISMAMLAVAACGRLHFDAIGGDNDGGNVVAADALTGCATPGAWGPGERIAGFAGINDPKLSADKKELYGVRFNVDFDFVRASRASAADAFPPDVVVALSSPARDVDPAITADGLELFFASDRATPGTAQIYIARRTTTDDAFTNPVLAPGLETESVYSLDISADGLSLYSAFGGGFGVATRPARDQPFTSPVAQLGVPGGYPTISFDELELYINSASVDRYTRADKAGAWVRDATFAIAGLTPRDPDLSHDGRELWFWSATDNELYRVTRACGP